MVEYLIVGIIVLWAVYFVWKSFRPKKGCGCGGSCGAKAQANETDGCCGSGGNGKLPHGIQPTIAESLLGKEQWDWKK